MHVIPVIVDTEKCCPHFFETGLCVRLHIVSIYHFHQVIFFLIYLKNIMIFSGRLISCSLVLEETTNDITWRCVRTLEREACLSGQQ